MNIAGSGISPLFCDIFLLPKIAIMIFLIWNPPRAAAGAAHFSQVYKDLNWLSVREEWWIPNTDMLIMVMHL